MMLMLGGVGLRGSFVGMMGSVLCQMMGPGSVVAASYSRAQSPVGIKYLRYAGTFQRLWIWNGYDN